MGRATVTIDLTPGQARLLESAARDRGTTADALIERWCREDIDRYLDEQVEAGTTNPWRFEEAVEEARSRGGDPFDAGTRTAVVRIVRRRLAAIARERRHARGRA